MGAPFNGPRHTTKRPSPTGMSSTSPTAPASTPLPNAPERDPSQAPDDDNDEDGGDDDSHAVSRPAQRSTEHAAESGFALPRLRLQYGDLGHAGAKKFHDAVDMFDVFPRAVRNVQRLLYVKASDPHTHTPPTRSVTLVLRHMDGVAYTTGIDLDDDHKEIHLSLPYVVKVKPELLASEMEGVLTHELVHCYQWNAKGTCPSGLIEGIADWVRLRCGLNPPHWKKDCSGAWDKGYQHTGYFLEYLETRFGEGTVRRLNEKLRLHHYETKTFWTELLGRPVEQLWDDYRTAMGSQRAG